MAITLPCGAEARQVDVRLRWIILIFMTFSALCAWAEDEAEVRQPVVVKPKRSSIGARSLPHLIELAEKNSPAIRGAQDILTISSLERENAGSVWFPKVDLTA